MTGNGTDVPGVLVTVGTTHHKFDRLMSWVQRWQAGRPDAALLLVQHGTSFLPAGATGFPMCSREELLEHVRRSAVVVTQGGPGGIMDSRYCGIVPIVVPRRPDLHEVVDDHQVRFCRHLARQGLIKLAEHEQEFCEQLDAALADPGRLRIAVDTGYVRETVDRMGALVEDLVNRRPPRHRRRRQDG